MKKQEIALKVLGKPWEELMPLEKKRMTSLRNNLVVTAIEAEMPKEEIMETFGVGEMALNAMYSKVKNWDARIAAEMREIDRVEQEENGRA